MKSKNKLKNILKNEEKVDNTEEEKSQPIDTSKLETKPIHKEKQIDTNNEQTEGQSGIQVKSTEKVAASKKEKPEVIQSKSIEKEETKIDENEEEQMNNEENIKELEP